MVAKTNKKKSKAKTFELLSAGNSDDEDDETYSADEQPPPIPDKQPELQPKSKVKKSDLNIPNQNSFSIALNGRGFVSVLIKFPNVCLGIRVSRRKSKFHQRRKKKPINPAREERSPKPQKTRRMRKRFWSDL
jgi:hypothetical protein